MSFIESTCSTSNTTKHKYPPHQRPRQTPLQSKDTTANLRNQPKSYMRAKKRNSKINNLVEEELSCFDSNQAAALTSPTDKRGNVSLTCLLNFSFPPRQQYPAYQGKKKTVHVTYNKERFVNSNYRFVVKEFTATGTRYDYTAYLSDPDLILPWECVEQIIVTTNHEIHCPICLHSPLCGRITKCGHVYCWTCLKRYLLLTDDKSKWRKCPICFDSFNIDDVKRVRLIICAEKSVERVRPSPENPWQLKFTLMKRAANCALCLPKRWHASWNPEDSEAFPSQPPLVVDANAFSWCRMLLSVPDYHQEQLLQDLNELQLIFAESDETEDTAAIAKKCMVAINLELQTVQSSDVAIGKKNKNMNQGVKDKPVDYFYFYQSNDGQNIFLHPLDIKILKREFLEYRSFPERLDLDVIHLSESTMTPDLRKRCKFLGHLPLHCDVSFCEIDWNGIVKKETFNFFSVELKQRIERHRSKDRKEENQRQKHLEEQQRQMSELIGFPSQSIEVFRPEMKDELFPTIQGSSPPTSDSPWSGPSFANIASTSQEITTTWTSPYKDHLLSQSNIEKESGWTLDLGVYEDVNVSESSNSPAKSKKKKGLLVVSNGGRRRY